MTYLPLKDLENAVMRRNSLLAERLRPGLAEAKVIKALERAGVKGDIGPLLHLYCWKNGTTIDRELASSRTGFFPGPAYQFTELGRATADFKMLQEASETRADGKKLAEGVGRYFPFLWNGAVRWIAVDLQSSCRSRVILIDTDAVRPYVEIYASFEEFLEDAIRANENNEPLTCLHTTGKPIQEAPVTQPEPAAKAVAPKAGKIPETENPVVLRTDFSDESAWRSFCKALRNPDDDFSPILDFVNDPAFDGLAAAALPSMISESSPHTFAFIVDRVALTRSDNPVLVMDLHKKPGRTFRVIASALGEVASNLSIANIDFDEFAKALDKEGVFRGF